MKFSGVALLAIVKTVSSLDNGDFPSPVERLRANVARFEEKEKIDKMLTSLEKKIEQFEAEDVELFTIEAYGSAMYLYAKANKRWAQHVGISAGSTDADKKWTIMLQNTTVSTEKCNGIECYHIKNDDSDRCLYAMPGDTGSAGVGADECTWYSNHWYIDSADCDGEVCYTLENAYSNRMLYQESGVLSADITEDPDQNKFKFLIPDFSLPTSSPTTSPTTQSPTKSPTQSPTQSPTLSFEVVEEVNCGLNTILTLEECSAYAESIGKFVYSIPDKFKTNRPKGCYRWIGSDTRLSYNDNLEAEDQTWWEGNMFALCKADILTPSPTLSPDI